jgi:hypothetical protein
LTYICRHVRIDASAATRNKKSMEKKMKIILTAKIGGDELKLIKDDGVFGIKIKNKVDDHIVFVGDTLEEVEERLMEIILAHIKCATGLWKI